MPAASFTHFLVKLVFAAPDSFLSAAWVSQAVAASSSHFFMKLVSAAPASFFPAAVSLQLFPCCRVFAAFGNGPRDDDARKQERKSKAFHGFLPARVVGWGSYALISMPSTAALAMEDREIVYRSWFCHQTKRDADRSRRSNPTAGGQSDS